MLHTEIDLKLFALEVLKLCKSDKSPDEISSIRDLFAIAHDASVNLSLNKGVAKRYEAIEPELWLAYGGHPAWAVKSGQNWYSKLNSSNFVWRHIRSDRTRKMALACLKADRDFFELLPPFEQKISKLKLKLCADEIFDSFNNEREDKELIDQLRNALNDVNAFCKDVFQGIDRLRLLTDFADKDSTHGASILLEYMLQRGEDEALSALSNSDNPSRYYNFTNVLLDGVFAGKVKSSTASYVLQNMSRNQNGYRSQSVDSLCVNLSHLIGRTQSALKNEASIDFLLCDFPSQLITQNFGQYSELPLLLLCLLHKEKKQLPEVSSLTQFTSTYNALIEYSETHPLVLERGAVELYDRGKMHELLDLCKIFEDDAIVSDIFDALARNMAKQIRSGRGSHTIFKDSEHIIQEISSWPEELIIKVAKELNFYFWDNDPRKMMDSYPGFLPLFKRWSEVEAWDDKKKVEFATVSRSKPVRLKLIKALEINPEAYAALPNGLKRELLSADFEL
jgi:hypothetical protein